MDRELLVNLANLWISYAEDIVKDKYAQASDYRECETWKQAANELLELIKSNPPDNGMRR